MPPQPVQCSPLSYMNVHEDDGEDGGDNKDNNRNNRDNRDGGKDNDRDYEN